MNTPTPVLVHAPRIEHHRCPLGIGEASPRLSWIVETGEPGWLQSGYELEIVDSHTDDVWRSGAVSSADSVLVAWPTAPLESRQRRDVRVRVQGRGASGIGRWSDWSATTRLETGLLDERDWIASAISPSAALHHTVPGGAPLLRSTFSVDGQVIGARLYVTAHGVYEMQINGVRVGDEVLAPGWTSYDHRLRYQTHDVTDLLTPGRNAIGAMLADGWYRGRLGFRGGRTELYGDRLALIAQLEISYADGGTDVVCSDMSWRCAAGPITSTGLYEGERYDARLERPGWATAHLDDSDWEPVDRVDPGPAALVAPAGPPVRRVEQLLPVQVWPHGEGSYLLDFGQNISGRLRIRVRGEAGRTVRIRHAEILEDGELCTRPLRLAAATDEYTLRGAPEHGMPEEWEPRFTLHGFRYAQVDNWPGALGHEDVSAFVCHTDMARVGWFTCSDPLLERFHDNVVWSMRGNFVDIPMDCPQRDERFGWTGDIQIFGPTASFLYDCTGMLSSWLADLAAEQRAFGTVPHYVPWVPLLFDLAPAAAWGDAAVLLPWTLFQRFGDDEVLRRQYPSMTAWIEQVTEIAGERHLWDRGFQFGDWLDPAAPPERPDAARTDKYLVASAYYAHTVQVMADIAAILGRGEDHRRYAGLAELARGAFNDEYVTPNGRLSSDSQTAYALAIDLDLLPKDSQRGYAGHRLAELVARDEHRIATGFVGTPLVNDALTATGHLEASYHLLTQRECPSWLYPVTMGATTVWERWDSQLPDGSINAGGMTSFNHYALGAVADWLHRVVAGLAPAAPGYRHLTIAPRPGGGLAYAGARHETPYGTASVQWRRSGVQLHVDVMVPPGVTALVTLPEPGWAPQEIGSGQHHFSCLWRPPQDDPPIPAPVDIYREAQRQEDEKTLRSDVK